MMAVRAVRGDVGLMAVVVRRKRAKFRNRQGRGQILAALADHRACPPPERASGRLPWPAARSGGGQAGPMRAKRHGDRQRAGFAAGRPVVGVLAQAEANSPNRRRDRKCHRQPDGHGHGDSDPGPPRLIRGSPPADGRLRDHPAFVQDDMPLLPTLTMGDKLRRQRFHHWQVGGKDVPVARRRQQAAAQQDNAEGLPYPGRILGAEKDLAIVLQRNCNVPGQGNQRHLLARARMILTTFRVQATSSKDSFPARMSLG